MDTDEDRQALSARFHTGLKCSRFQKCRSLICRVSACHLQTLMCEWVETDGGEGRQQEERKWKISGEWLPVKNKTRLSIGIFLIVYK